MEDRANAFVLDLHRASRRLSHPVLRNWIFEQLAKVIQLDSAIWLRWAIVDDQAVIHGWYLHRQPDSLLHEYTTRELWRADVVHREIAARPGGAAVRASCDDHKAHAVREFLKRYRQEHSLTVAVFDDVPGVTTGITLYRNETRLAFDESDAHCVEIVAPHIFEAIREKWLYELGQSWSSEPESVEFAMAVLMPDLRISEAQDNFGELVLRQWPSWRGPLIPDTLRAHLARAQPWPWLGNEIAIYHRHQQDGTTLLRVRAGHPMDKLGSRKREVALLFAQGASQTDVASQLHLSPSTVNNYLGAVYRELGLSGKPALARLVRRLQP